MIRKPVVVTMRLRKRSHGSVLSKGTKRNKQTSVPISSTSPSDSSSGRVSDSDSTAKPGARVVFEYESLIPARLVRRYKRFLADVLLDAEEEGDSGEPNKPVTVYCPNTGPMVGLLDQPLAPVRLSKNTSGKRKYEYTLEMIQVHNGARPVWVGVHSALANRMMETALTNKWLSELLPYDSFHREVRLSSKSRVDFVLRGTNSETGRETIKYVEVKSVTLASSGPNHSIAFFPDTVSLRAQKHVQELIELVTKTECGTRRSPEQDDARVEVSGAIVFLIQRDDCDVVTPSGEHDPVFAALCSQAQQQKSNKLQLLAVSCQLGVGNRVVLLDRKVAIKVS